MAKNTVKGLKERLNDGETVLCAEGYLFEFERRGYLKAGSYVPEVVLEHPEFVRGLHEEYVHAGSDIVEAFTYYGHREKMRLIGREADLEPLNRNALKIAREVADETGTLMAGNLSNTTVYLPDKPSTHQTVREMYRESVRWAVEGGSDLIIAETIADFGEAKLALEAIQQYAPGIPSVINLSLLPGETTRDGVDYVDALVKLEDLGADVVGFNCSVGPTAMIPIMKEARSKVKGPLASLPVPYQATRQRNMLTLKTNDAGIQAFPHSLDAFYTTDAQIRAFGKGCLDNNVQFIGICCGNSSRYFRALAESIGRTPPASKYSPDMSQHYIFGNHSSFSAENTGLSG